MVGVSVQRCHCEEPKQCHSERSEEPQRSVAGGDEAISTVDGNCTLEIASLCQVEG